MNFTKLISGHLRKSNFLFYSVFLFSESNAVLSHRHQAEFQDLRRIKNRFNAFNMFTKILSRTAQWLSCFALMISCERQASKVIYKVCDFVMIKKNNTFISCVFNGPKYTFL